MKTRILFLTGLVSIAMAVPASAAVALVNGSFEDPLTYDGPPFVGSWEAFSGGAGATAANSSTMVRSGAQSLELSILGVNDTFAGVFQDVEGLVAGTDYVFSGWNASPSNPLDLTPEVRIEWRNSGSNTEIARTPNLVPEVGADFSQFSLVATAPDGADTARLVYAVQTFTGGEGNNGIVYVDDVSFAVVPEPSTISLLLAGGLLLGTLRRLRA